MFHQDGYGFVNIIRGLISPQTPPEVKNTLEKYGNEKITHIEIYREIFKEDEAIFFQNLEQSILKWIKLFESNEHPLCERKFNNLF